jgi:hypothetical protein
MMARKLTPFLPLLSFIPTACPAGFALPAQPAKSVNKRTVQKTIFFMCNPPKIISIFSHLWLNDNFPSLYGQIKKFSKTPHNLKIFLKNCQ